jgi:hypothetical protein
LGGGEPGLSPKLDRVCNGQNNIGIELRTWKGQMGGTGSIWKNIQFRNFNHGSCQYVTPISMEYSVSFKRSLQFAFSIRFLTNLLLFCLEKLVLTIYMFFT